MKKLLSFKVILAVVIILIVGTFMVNFKESHSAKETLREAGIRYYRMGSYQDAEECFTLALKQQEAFTEASDHDIYFYLADCSMKQEEYKEAMVYYTKLQELGVNDTDLYGNMGICEYSLGDEEKAYTYLKQACEAQDKVNKDTEDSKDNSNLDASSNVDIYYTFVLVCQDLGNYEDALTYAKKGYDILNNNLSDASKQLLNNAGSTATNASSEAAVSSTALNEIRHLGLFAYLSNEDIAYNCFTVLDAYGDEDAKAYMAASLASKGEYQTAIDKFTEYLSNHSENEICDTKLAYSYFGLKSYDKVLEYIDKALAYNNPETRQELLYEKGTSLEYLGRFDEAFDVFSEFVKDYPDDETAKREYEFLVTRISNDKAAEAGVDNGNLE